MVNCLASYVKKKKKKLLQRPVSLSSVDRFSMVGYVSQGGNGIQEMLGDTAGVGNGGQKLEENGG